MVSSAVEPSTTDWQATPNRARSLFGFRVGPAWLIGFRRWNTLDLSRWKLGDQLGVVFRTCRDLDHGHADLGGKELVVILSLVSMTAPAAVVLDHQVHFLDPLVPNDRIVLPEFRHGNVLLVDAGFLVDRGVEAAITILLALVGDVAD